MTVDQTYLAEGPTSLSVVRGGFATAFAHDPATRRSQGCLYDASGAKIDPSERVGGVGGDRVLTLNPSSMEPPAGPMLEGRSLYLGHFMAQYGHFIVESLSTAWSLDLVTGVDRYVLHPFVFGTDIPRFAEVLWSVLGVDRSRVHILSEPTRFEEVLVPERLTAINRNSHVAMRPVYRRLAAAFGREGPERLFLSRSRLLNDPRRLDNELEVEAVFAAAGFEVIHPQELPIEQQLRLYAACKVMAGFAGSALHNVLFCRPGVVLVNLCDARSRSEVQLTQAICNALAQARVTVAPFTDRTGLAADVRVIDALIAGLDGLRDIGAGEEIRTLDPNLGKVVLYH